MDKLDITVVVNGQPTVVEANPNAPLRTIIPRALEETGNVGQPPEQWELRDSAGTLLDLGKKIEEFGFPENVTLFLNLKAGVGGLQVLPAQFVDPSVSRAKFNREIKQFQSLDEEYRRRGWLLVRARYPEVLVVLAAPNLKPPAIVTGVAFDYTNYDAEPPSVRLVNPFTGAPYRANELPTRLNRSIQTQEIELPVPDAPRIQLNQQQPLMQAYSPDDVPFLCLAGVREYHHHPAHSGDAWELHRASGAGRLVRLLEVIHRYGVQTIKGYSVQLVPQVRFQEVENPE